MADTTEYQRASMWVRFSVVLALAAFAAVAVAVYREVAHWREAVDLALHSQEVVNALGLTRENLARAESAQRTYLLTNRPEFLTERDNAIAAMKAAMEQLKDRMGNSPHVQDRFWELETLTTQRVAIALRSAHATGARLIEDIRSASQITAQVYDVSRDMERQERYRLAALQLEHRDHRYAEALVVLALVVGAGTLLVPAYLDAKRQRQLRRRLERKMADLVENLPVTAWRVRSSPQGQHRFEFVAASALQARGLDAAEVVKDSNLVMQHVVEEDKPGLVAAINRCFRTLEPLDQTYRIKLADGSLHWIRSCATLRREHDGSVLWHGHWQDISEQKSLEAELRAVNGELEAFAYSVSHDLRAPLSAIDGFSQVLVERAAPVLDERSRNYLMRIRAAASLMAELIEGILALSRLTRHELRYEQVDLSALAREVVDDLRRRQPDRQVEVVIESNLLAHGDPRLLRQVLANLLENAWKFTARVSAAAIHFGAGIDREGQPCFFVRDNGAGFDMAYADKLFGAFQRLHKASEFPGTGIGLATVMRIVHRHGGRIWAEAQEGKGATFHFCVPSRVADAKNQLTVDAP